MVKRHRSGGEVTNTTQRTVEWAEGLLTRDVDELVEETKQRKAERSRIEVHA